MKSSFQSKTFSFKEDDALRELILTFRNDESFAVEASAQTLDEVSV